MARISCILIAFMLCCNGYTSAQTTVPLYEQDSVYAVIDTSYENIDTTATEVIEDNSQQSTFTTPQELVFAKEDLQRLQQEPDYQYMTYIDSLLRNRKLEPEEKKIADNGESISLEWVKPLLWIFAILALLFVLYKLWADNAGLFKPFDKKAKPADIETPEDPLIVQGAAALAQQAIHQKDYRSAVRYLFIDALARLDDRGLIYRIARKTNQQYLAEIQQPELKELVATLMLQFEYVWYGEFTPNEQQFNRIVQSYKQLEVRWL